MPKGREQLTCIKDKMSASWNRVDTATGDTVCKYLFISSCYGHLSVLLLRSQGIDSGAITNARNQYVSGSVGNNRSSGLLSNERPSASVGRRIGRSYRRASAAWKRYPPDGTSLAQATFGCASSKGTNYREGTRASIHFLRRFVLNLGRHDPGISFCLALQLMESVHVLTFHLFLPVAMQIVHWDALAGALWLRTRNRACCSARNAALSASTCLLGPIETSRFAPATITGRPRQVVLNAREDHPHHQPEAWVLPL